MKDMTQAPEIDFDALAQEDELHFKNFKISIAD